MLDALLSPIQIGRTLLKNRIAMAPMGVEIVEGDGVVREPTIRYYEERARGGAGLLITGMTGGYMASRNWSPGDEMVPVALLSELLPPFVGQLPRVIGVEPVYTFPAAIFVMAFFSFFIGTFLQLLWEDIPITEPL